MNDSRSHITLDFRDTHAPVVIRAKRGDTGRVLYISLADGGTPYVIADGCYATFTAKKPDSTKINNACTIENNMIVYAFTEQTCSCVGRMKCEIKLYGSNGRMLTSASFILEVHRTVFNEGDVLASEDDMNALDALILETTALKEEVEQKLESGEFNGVDGEAATFEIVAAEKLDPDDAPTATETDDSTEQNRKYTIGIPAGQPGYTPQKGTDYFTEEDKTEIVEQVLTDERFTDMQTAIADLQYEPVSITSFTNNAGTKELGSTVTEVTLIWALNKAPKTLALDDEFIGADLTSLALTGLEITANKTFTLAATDERKASATKTTGITFYNGVYYGAAEAPESIDSGFVLGLTKVLSGSRKRSFTAEAGEGQYIWYCIPKRLGECTFKVGGFEGGFDLVATTEFTNAHGYTESYYVYRSANSALGSTTVEVS